jgi:signal transduction histidine kinase
VAISRIRTGAALLAAVVLLGVGVAFAALAVHQLRVTTERLDRVLSEHADAVIGVERLRVASERIGRTTRSHLLSNDETFLDEMHEARAAFTTSMGELLRRDDDGHLRAMLAPVDDLQRRHAAAIDAILGRRGGMTADEAVSALQRDVQPLRNDLNVALNSLAAEEHRRFREARDEGRAAASSAMRRLVVLSSVALGLALVLTFAIARVLRQLARSRAELQASHERLELVNRDLDAFAGRIAHDLRNALAPQRLLVARLRRSADATSVADTAARLDATGRRAERLIQSLLAFARGGAASPGDASASAAAVAREAAEDVAPLVVDVDASIRLALDDAVVRCSPALLHTVLVNLLGNALKFVRGRANRDVSLSTRTVGAFCEISVSDTGPGIPDAWRSKVFDPFTRVPGTTAPGFGIGLATVHRIVRGHGGDVFVRPNPGAGVTFVVQLPIATAPGAAGLVGGSAADGVGEP